MPLRRPILDDPPIAPDRLPSGLGALEELASRALALDPPARHELSGILRPDAAELVDRLLARVARSRGALDVAIGERLAALAVGDRVLRLGFSGLGDYARERLGIAGRTAQAMARLARELADRPLLREAVRRGLVSIRRAQAVLPVARGEGEARWLARARSETVRALEAAVRGTGASGPDPDEDQDWERILVDLTAKQRAVLDEGLEVAGRLVGPASPPWQRLEVMCQEYLGSHPAPPPTGDAGEDEPVLHDPVTDWRRRLEAWLEEESGGWHFLEALQPVAAPAGPDPEANPLELDSQLRRLAAMRDRWDEVLGHLALLFKWVGLWRVARFASFAHYCTERLGMSPRAVEQRAALARRLYDLPSLRRAMREGRLSYEKARLLSRWRDDDAVRPWIERAEGMTCIELRRAVEAHGDAQMRARSTLEMRVPGRVLTLLGEAFRAVRAGSTTWIGPGACLERVAAHFIETWKGATAGRKGRHRDVLARDRGLCRVPGCSRAAAHVHHVTYRSRGGGDEPSNLVSVCAAHHLHGIHLGYVRVEGVAPDGLSWELGTPAGGVAAAPPEKHDASPGGIP